MNDSNTTVTPESELVDRFTYQGNRFPWWMLVIWICFIAGSTWYTIRYMLPNLSVWVEKPPYTKYVP